MKYCEAWIRTDVLNWADVACDIAGSKDGIRGDDLNHTYVRNMNDRSKMRTMVEKRCADLMTESHFRIF
jgi:hypothetical protein